MDNHSEADAIRNFPANICKKYVDKLYWGSVCDNTNPESGVRNYFYSRFRFLFVPDVSGTWYFAVDSNDGAELILNKDDSDNDHTKHTLIASWYGVHGWCNCQNASGTIDMIAGQGYWFDYIQEEWSGVEAAVLWVKRPGDVWKVLSVTNFPNQIFARPAY
ncbi:MAG: hypothetical protein KatS3mg096_390 [Candidatus Parcubacteria bacterium]|nr:MAG: hypothetical protein KatS3mg096_390 [Candidatus Parcubacteria bacterium]